MALALGRGVGVVGLEVFLHPVAGVTTGDRARHGGNLLATAATDLLAGDAAHNRADGGAQEVVFILHRLAVHDGHILAHLARSLDGFLHRLHLDYLGKLRTFIDHLIRREGAPGDRNQTTQHHTR